MPGLKRITDLADATTLVGDELLEVSQISDTVTISASTISAAASDNSFNDSGNGFITAGFSVDDRIKVTGFVTNTVNNLLVGTITAITAGKITIGGTDGDVIVDESSGSTITISKWTSAKATVGDLEGGASYPSFAGNSGKHLAVNVTEDNVEWVVPAAGGGGGAYVVDTVEVIDLTGHGSGELIIAVNGADDLIITGSNIADTNSGAAANLRVSIDGGSTYLDTSGDYQRMALSESYGGEGLATSIEFIGYNSSSPGSSYAIFFGINNAAPTIFNANNFRGDAFNFSGFVATTSAFTHVKLYSASPSVGNFTSGTVYVTRRKYIKAPYDIRFGFVTTPTSDEVIDTLILPRDITLPADLAGSVGAVGTNPTASFVLSLQDDAVEIATITIDTGGSFTFATTGGVEIDVVSGSVLSLVAPTSIDAIVANMVMSLVGSLS